MQVNEPQPEEDDDFELPDDFQPFMQDYPLYTDNTANGEMDYASLIFFHRPVNDTFVNDSSLLGASATFH